MNTVLSFALNSIVESETDASLSDLTVNSFQFNPVDDEPLQRDIAILFDPQPDMQGSIVLSISVWDDQDLNKTRGTGQAVLTFVKEEDQVTLNFLNYYKDVEKVKRELQDDALQSVLGRELDADTRIDQIVGITTIGDAVNRTRVMVHFQRNMGTVIVSWVDVTA